MNLFEKYKDSTINSCDIKTLTDEVAKLIMPDDWKPEKNLEVKIDYFIESVKFLGSKIYDNFDEYDYIETLDISYTCEHFFSVGHVQARVLRDTLVYILAYIVKRKQYGDYFFGIAMMRLYILLKESLCKRYNELKGE